MGGRVRSARRELGLVDVMTPCRGRRKRGRRLVGSSCCRRPSYPQPWYSRDTAVVVVRTLRHGVVVGRRSRSIRVLGRAVTRRWWICARVGIRIMVRRKRGRRSEAWVLPEAVWILRHGQRSCSQGRAKVSSSGGWEIDHGPALAYHYGQTARNTTCAREETLEKLDSGPQNEPSSVVPRKSSEGRRTSASSRCDFRSSTGLDDQPS